MTGITNSPSSHLIARPLLDMVHLHNAYSIPEFTPAQLETLTAICDTLFQAHSGEEATAIRARLPKDCPEWQKAKGG